jgi:hypothetical protein
MSCSSCDHGAGGGPGRALDDIERHVAAETELRESRRLLGEELRRGFSWGGLAWMRRGG